MPRERLWQVRARQVVIAAGAHERPLVFPGNDRPGVMLAGAARTFLHRYGVAPGRRAVIVATGEAAYRTALDLHTSGVQIAAIVDLRAQPTGLVFEVARKAGLPVRTGGTVLETFGGLRLSGARLASVDADGGIAGGEIVDCDSLLMSGGFTPSVHLFSQSRGKLAWSAEQLAFLPSQSAEAERSAGACRGVFDLASAVRGWRGSRRGGGAAAAAGSRTPPPSSAEEGGFVGALPQRPNARMGKAFVDFQNDVTAKDIRLAVREGFKSIEHIKRYTTTGMATDQGKTSNINALGVVAQALDRPVPQIGLTTFRMPYTPVTFGALAGMARGDLFDPVRRTPIHGWAEERGAAFEDVGNWKRAHYFPIGAEDMHAAVDRECQAVRSSVGIFDASTLGKIEIVGRDAAEFMNRMYVNAWTKLGVGKCRYGVLLHEDGFITDDGVVGRMAKDRFHVTTTTGGAPRVLAMMEDYRQTEWPDLDVWLTSTTEQWSVIALQGPRARKILAGLAEDIDLSPEALPHMSLAEGRICGVPTRLFRVSFSGELGFEVNVAPDHGRAVWEAIWAGRPARHGIVAYGTETMHVLRAEKGYIIVGQDTDGTVTPDDAGLGWAIGKAKKDFVGKRSWPGRTMSRPDRKQLVGLFTEDPRKSSTKAPRSWTRPARARPCA